MRRASWGRTLIFMAGLVACAEESAPPVADRGRDGDASRSPAFVPREDLPAVVFLGDSLTAGRGLDPAEAYPALLRPRLRERGFEAWDAGRSGDTTRGGLARLDALLQRDVAVLVVALGGNDMLRGVPLEETERNLREIVETARARAPAPRVVLAGMRALPNLGVEYCEAFDGLYPRLAEELDVALVPFLLEGVGGEQEFNQDDGIHPNREGQRRLAETVWATLEGVLEDLAATRPGGDDPDDENER